MITVRNLSYSFPQKDLYNNVSFTIEEQAHCAFIGSSGTGKSTLINIIRNPDDYLYDGKIEKNPLCKIGYVSQFPDIDPEDNQTIFDYLAAPFKKMQEKMDILCEEMGTSEDLEPLLEQYQQLLDEFQALDGDNYETNIAKNLNIANIKHYNELRLQSLSGGEFKLIQVIREMLKFPTLLIMDEPDVFLDFDHLNSLTELINSHKGTLLVITHNRYLLNHCFNKILHLENADIQEFNGNYIEYNFSLQQEKIEQQEKALADEAEIKRHEKVVEKYRSQATYYTCATRGRALHARVSMLERLKANQIKAPFVDIKQPKISFFPVTVSEESETFDALSVTDYSIGFQENLLEHVSFTISSKDKVALIGANGTGKTTLLHEIYHNNNEHIQFHETIKTAFLSQNQGEMLTETNTIAEELFEAGVETYADITALITRYGFTEDMLEHPISKLSGGEKNLLQLAKISLSPANMLLLDEPTSHLDLYSQLALEKAIKDYQGAILMVSHDFYTIANCMDYVLLIEDKTIRRLSIRKFRKMIYGNHFDKDYLLLEQKKKELETKVSAALKNKDLERAKKVSEELLQVIEQM